MAKYIQCSGCGKRIEMGEDVCTFDGHIFCEPYCLAVSLASFNILDESLAAFCNYVIYDDSQRIKELKAKIPKMKTELKLLELELAGLERPFFEEYKMKGKANK